MASLKSTRHCSRALITVAALAASWWATPGQAQTTYNLGFATSTGTTSVNWDTTTTWSPTGTPGAADTIAIAQDLLGTTTINYASGVSGTVSIATISVIDSNAAAGSGAFVALNPGVAGSALQFSTTSPAVTTNIVNVNSAANQVTVQNPLFQAGSSFTKGGTGNVRLWFQTATSGSSFSNNVTSLSGTGGTLWLANFSGSTMALPTINFDGTGSADTGLAINNAGFAATGKTIALGSAGLTLGGNGSLTLQNSSTMSGGEVSMGSNNSNYFYLNGGATLTVNDSVGTFTTLNMGNQQAGGGTATVNVQSGTLSFSSTGSMGNPTNSANQTQTMLVNVSGGLMRFTKSDANWDFVVGNESRTSSSNVLTLSATATVSGTGMLDMGTRGRLVLGRDANANASNVAGVVNLAGGTLQTAREIARGANTGIGGTDRAQVFLNSGTLRATAAIPDLFTGFTGPNDGVFVSAGNAVIDTGAFAVGIAGNLLANPASAGGGLVKLGSGTLTLSGSNTYSGTTTISAGGLSIGAGGSIGSIGGDVANAGTLIFNRSDAQTFAGTITGTGNLIVRGTGPLLLTGTNVLSGNTTLESGASLTLGAGSSLGTGALAYSGTAVPAVNLGGNAQTVASFAISGPTAAFSSPLLTNGSLAVSGTANLVLSNALNGTIFDFSQLSAFAYTSATGTMTIQPATGTATVVNSLVLAAGSNSITAATINVGGAAGSSQGTGHEGRMLLGSTNAFNAATFTVGAFNGSGRVQFQPGVTSPAVVFRGVGGGDSRLTTLQAGYTSSGVRAGEGVIDLTGAIVDARVGTLLIGQHIAGANNGETSSFTMSSGTFDATAVLIGEKLNGGNPIMTDSFNQSGGTVVATTIRMGRNEGAGTPRFVSAYNLSSGTLRATSIISGTGTVEGSTTRSLNWAGGTIANYDAATDLSIEGSGIGTGLMRVVLGGAGQRTFLADAGRTITLGTNTAVTGTGGFTKAGAGSLVVATTAAYTGATLVNAGSLVVNGVLSGSSAVTVAGGATLGGSGSLTGPVSILGGGILAPGTSPGTLSIGNDLVLDLAALLAFELDGGDTTVGGGVNDLVTGVSNLTLAGTLDVTAISPFTGRSSGSWRLFNYTGTLTNAGLTLGSMPALDAGSSFQIDTSTAGQVNLVVVPEPSAIVLLAAATGCAASRAFRRRRWHAPRR